MHLTGTVEGIGEIGLSGGTPRPRIPTSVRVPPRSRRAVPPTGGSTSRRPRWSSSIESSNGAPPRSPGSSTVYFYLSPAYENVTGDYFFLYKGKYYRAVDATFDLPLQMSGPGAVTTETAPYHGDVVGVDAGGN